MTDSVPQGTFDFFDNVEKKEPAPKPKRHTLRPPTQIEIVEEKPAPAPVNNVVEETVMEIQQPISTAVSAVDEVDIDDSHSHIENDTVPVITEKKDESEVAVVTAEEKKTSGRGRKSFKEMSEAATEIEMPDDEVLFQKHYYSMGEVTAMFNENHSLIRYWEAEFDILKPKKNGKGDRFFRPVDVKNLYLIYDLLRRRKFTIEGAKEYLKSNKKADEKFAAIQSLQKIKSFFLELKAGL